MSKHTPGPWLILRNGCSPGNVGTLEGHNVHGEPLYWTTATANRLRDEWEANERLIAAAPDLLEALRQVAEVEWFDRSDNSVAEYEEWVAAFAAVRAAIAKATGEGE